MDQLTHVWIAAFCDCRTGEPWELCGIFTTREGAVAACRDRRYGIARIRLNETAPVETTPMPGVEHPNQSEPVEDTEPARV